MSLSLNFWNSASPIAAGASATQTLSKPSEGHVLRIVQDPNGLGMRGLAGTRPFESRSIPCEKAGGSFRTEAGVEPRRGMRLMFDTSVIAIVHQLARFEGKDEEGPWRILPDTAILYGCGRRVVEECKSDWSQLERDPAYVRRLRIVEEEINRRGWEFNLHVAEAERDPVLEDNIAMMFPLRNTVYTKDAVVRAQRALVDGGGFTTLGRLARAVSDTPALGCAIAYSMMADRLVDIDLSRQLSDNSPVRTVPRPVPELPPLRF